MKKYGRVAAVCAGLAAACLLWVLARPAAPRGQIYLYGEAHNDPFCYDLEFENWHTLYHEQGMRHLFMEWPYYYAGYINLWMQSGEDTILDMLWEDYAGSAGTNEAHRSFLQRIKEECPETVFHGTDVGHQTDVTGVRYLAWLEEQGQQDTEAYALAQENIEQGRYYYETEDEAYREDTMAENFVHAFEALGGESVMGIYGNAHTRLDAMDYFTRTVPCLANRLAQRYGAALHVEQLTDIVRRVDEIRVDGKLYQASYFGYYILTDDLFNQGLDVWRLEDAWEQMQAFRATGESFAQNDFSVTVGEKEVYLLEYTRKDGVKTRYYCRTVEEGVDGEPMMEWFVLAR